MVWTAQVALACGELDVAHRRADIAVSASKRFWLATALSTRACVRVAQREYEQAAADAYESLMIANAIGYTSLHRRHAGMPRPHGVRRRKSLRSDPPTWSRGIDTGSVWVSSVSKFSMTTTMRWYRHCETRWATRISTRRGPRVRRCRPRKPSPTRCAAAANASGRRRGWGSLTPTELDVVRLVAEGIPNKDIATRLFVSPRTVQTHLRHVYNKLGLTSRVQLAQEAARHAAEKMRLWADVLPMVCAAF